MNNIESIYNKLIVNNNNTLIISIVFAIFAMTLNNIKYEDDLKEIFNKEYIKAPILILLLMIIMDNFTLGLSLLMIYSVIYLNLQN